MRITQRQLTQIIREELIREARAENPDVVALQKALGVSGADVDGIWGGVTDDKWGEFVKKRYTGAAVDVNVSVKEIQDDWASAGPKLGFTGDAASAVKFINILNDFARKPAKVPAETSSALRKNAPQAPLVGPGRRGPPGG